MTTDWQAVLRTQPDLDPRPGCTEAELAAAEAQLGETFPAPLRHFLVQVNGVCSRGGQWFVGWPLDRIVDYRLDYQVHFPGCAPPRQFWAFGDNGSGAPYCLRDDGSPTVYLHYPIGGETVEQAASLVDFWTSFGRTPTDDSARTGPRPAAVPGGDRPPTGVQ